MICKSFILSVVFFFAWCFPLKKKSLNFVQINLLFFSFVTYAFDIISKKLLKTQVYKSSIISSKIFIVLAIILDLWCSWSYILYIVWGSASAVFFCLWIHMDIRFQHHLLKGLFFHHWMAAASLSRVNWW